MMNSAEVSSLMSNFQNKVVTDMNEHIQLNFSRPLQQMEAKMSKFETQMNEAQEHMIGNLSILEDNIHMEMDKMEQKAAETENAIENRIQQIQDKCKLFWEDVEQI